MIDIAAADGFMAALPMARAYRVGGSVRDEMLGRAVKDADYVVCGVPLDALDALLCEAGAATRPLRLRDNGPQVGVRASVPGVGRLEVCLPRVEVSTGTGRHDFEMVIDHTIDLQGDAVRRDFTMNALYRDARTRDIYDPLHGTRDLRARRIRTTFHTSFREDPLRALRALRFVSTLGFDLTNSTLLEMCEHAQAVTGLTRKGVSSTALDELIRILMGAQPGRALRLARDTGVLVALLPELEPMVAFDQRSRYHTKTVDEHTFSAVQAAADLGPRASLRTRLALLFHDSGKPAAWWVDPVTGDAHYYARRHGDLPHEILGARVADRALRRLNSPRKLREDVVQLIERHMLPVESPPRKSRVHTLRAELGDTLLGDLLVHRRCDLLGKDGGASEGFEVLDRFEILHRRARMDRVPREVRELHIGGADLVALGLRGKAVGEVQRVLLHEVMCQPELNVREWLLGRAAHLAKKR